MAISPTYFDLVLRWMYSDAGVSKLIKGYSSQQTKQLYRSTVFLGCRMWSEELLYEMKDAFSERTLLKYASEFQPSLGKDCVLEIEPCGDDMFYALKLATTKASFRNLFASMTGEFQALFIMYWAVLHPEIDLKDMEDVSDTNAFWRYIQGLGQKHADTLLGYCGAANLQWLFVKLFKNTVTRSSTASTVKKFMSVAKLNREYAEFIEEYVEPDPEPEEAPEPEPEEAPPAPPPQPDDVAPEDEDAGSSDSDEVVEERSPKKHGKRRSESEDEKPSKYVPKGKKPPPPTKAVCKAKPKPPTKAVCKAKYDEEDEDD